MLPLTIVASTQGYPIDSGRNPSDTVFRAAFTQGDVGTNITLNLSDVVQAGGGVVGFGDGTAVGFGDGSAAAWSSTLAGALPNSMYIKLTAGIQLLFSFNTITSGGISNAFQQLNGELVTDYALINFAGQDVTTTVLNFVVLSINATSGAPNEVVLSFFG